MRRVGFVGGGGGLMIERGLKKAFAQRGLKEVRVFISWVSRERETGGFGS